MKPTLAIIEAHPALREVWQMYFCIQPEFEVVVAAESMEELVAMLLDGGRKPHLILVDGSYLRPVYGEDLNLLRKLAPQAGLVLMQEVQSTATPLANVAERLNKHTSPPVIKQTLLRMSTSSGAASAAMRAR
ncbi:hypothetical protein ACFPAF_07145 [Hymenobacter endophyticus]|uniref:Response regulator transcription factor n=1 Tax=Hymenobacter endophyticus TaxID=3076335 RepID=A0ABU3TFL6_9BACT|nr:hypothetical protein [Hymenobacter endophyticus]MDU0370159.1 hypothetical protein [Hymenobacter endophyticus]